MKFSHDYYDSQKKLRDIMAKKLDVFESLIEMVKEKEQDREFGYIFGITYNYHNEFLYYYYGLIENLIDMNFLLINADSIYSFHINFINCFKHLVEGFFIHFTRYSKINSLDIIDYICNVGVENLTFVNGLSQEEISFIKEFIDIFMKLK